MFKSKTIVLFGVLATSGVASADLNTGLVAYYPFNGNANDESGNGNHGVVEGAQLTADVLGNPNSAYSFDGNSNQIVIADSPELNFGNAAPQSISMWLDRTDTQEVMHFIGKRTGCGFDFGNYQFAFNESSGENIVYARASSNTRLPINEWTHLVVSYDGVEASMYINGALFSKKATSLGDITSSPLLIAGSGACAHFKGKIDEVRLYNRALTRTEISMLYDQYTPVSGSVKSLTVHTVSCKNKTTRQIVYIPATKARNYDCEANGLKVNHGDKISIMINGKAQ